MIRPINADGLQRLRQLVDGFPDRLAEATEQVQRMSRTQLTVASPDGAVVVTATGAGEVTAIRFNPMALRELDNFALGERITAAVNDVLSEIERMRSGMVEAGPSAPDGALDDAAEMFDYRIDGLLDQLDAISRGLDD